MFNSLSDARAARANPSAPARQRSLVMRFLPFFGPALIAAVAYIDPGNFATNIEAGSRYGYTLLWVVLWANLMAMLIQTLSVRLGLATGRNLAEMIRERYPRPLVWFYWVQAELVAIATDLAEFLGAALAFHLLFGLSMLEGALLTGAVTYAALTMQRYGFRLLEVIIGSMLLAVAAGFIAQILMGRPDAGPALTGMLVPQFPDGYAVFLAAGILGATVMPHVIYLHSSLSQRRIPATTDDERKRAMRFYRWDVIIGMGVAGVINLSMLALAAAVFFDSGRTGVASIEQSYQLLAPLMNRELASTLFGFTLLLAGLSSSIVGTMAGQVVMQGFVGFTIPIWLRRLLTMLPAIAVIMLGLPEQQVLVASQVVLSFGIPFALVPLIQFTARRGVMGNLVSRRWVTLLGCVVAGVIILLNGYVLAFELL
ncbi:Nramp family divalent metal transporter [Salinicola sp. JS01]|uniref:Nramp family divalent metal transporter n=1 Tax=unclassified Salinicola TaxID=2634022 RepID=UPI001E37255E|nr:Nramp family divalent metal transporter [Salinicola sp. JS01]MCE3028307.1 Nramp family divalent metal transporter [Salinicola sp. DM10]WIX33652.1 Nramp family divalent metal transporter [Salinicola sp. JS01]